MYNIQSPFLYLIILLITLYRPTTALVNDKHNPSHDVIHAEKIIKKLLNDETNTYDHDLIPIDEGKVLEVKMHLVVTEITNFDGVNQALSFICWVRLNWFDKRLSWDPKEYNNVTSIRISPPRIWKPDLTLYNSADGRHQFTEDMINQVHCRIYFDGEIIWTPIVMYTVTCPMRLEFFPFDVQLCQATFGSWVHNMERLYFNLTETKVKLDKFTQNNVWFLKDTLGLDYAIDYGETWGRYQEVRFFFFLKRNYTQYILNVVLTCSLLCALCFFSFWIPVGAGERLSLSLSVIVAISVYQLIAATLIPTGTDKTPVLSTFLAVMAVLVDLSVVITMINLKIAYQIQVERPAEWFFKLWEYVGRIFRIQTTYEYKNYESVKKAHNKLMKTRMKNVSFTALRMSRAASMNENDTKKANEVLNSLKTPPKSIKRTELTPQDEQIDDYILKSSEKLADVEWNVVSLCIDRFCMLLYGVSFLTMLIWMFVRLDTYSSQMKSLAKSVMEIDVEGIYDCYIRDDYGDLYLDEKETQLFCDKNQTKWDLI